MDLKKSVAIFLINPDNKMLFQLRDNKKSIPFPGFWSLIGGGVEGNETDIQAIIREIKEEINCEVKNIALIGEINFFNRKRKLLIYKGEINTSLENISLMEGQDINFFYKEELRNLKIPYWLKDFIFKKQFNRSLTNKQKGIG
ncbi:MAG: NUDIX domain-containing protein [Nanoarchaeota archaeon]